MKIINLIKVWRIALRAHNKYQELFLMAHLDLVNPELIKKLHSNRPVHWRLFLFSPPIGIEYYKKRLYYLLTAINYRQNPNGDLETSQYLMSQYIDYLPKRIAANICSDFKRYQKEDEQAANSSAMKSMLAVLVNINQTIRNEKNNYPFSDN